MFLKISRHGDMKAVSYIVFLALWSSLSIKSLSKRLCFLLMVNEACWTHSMLRYVTVGACSSLSWVWPHDIFPLHGSISIYITVAPVLFLPPFLGETISQQTSWCSESHDLSSPSSVLFPEPQMQELWCRSVCGPRRHMIRCSYSMTHWGFLWSYDCGNGELNYPGHESRYSLSNAYWSGLKLCTYK